MQSTHFTAGYILYNFVCDQRNNKLKQKGTVLGYLRNLGSLSYGNEYCVPCRTMTLHNTVLLLQLSLPEILCRNARLYSQMPPPILAGSGGLHWFVSLSLHKPMAVQLHCVIEKVFSPQIKNEYSPLASSDAVLVPVSQETEFTYNRRYFPMMVKLNFQHHHSIVQFHMMLQKLL